MNNILNVKLKMRLKNGDIKIVVYEKVSDLYIDYENNKLSLIDIPTGFEYKYHFRETGKEREQEAVEILHMEILTKEE
jgi:hypothetical protein